MKKLTLIMAIAIGTFGVLSCEKEVRNIAPPATNPSTGGGGGGQQPSGPVEVNPVDINVDGYDFMEKMQGHWVGVNRVIADDYPWFGWDFRAISPSHVFGIFEGGTMGNLFSSFFITDFKGKRTIMARNGGLLNGIYRTSYFVLDSVSDGTNGKYFRFIDANGGQRVMSMEMRFKGDSLYYNAYTSKLGKLNAKRHMTFKAKKRFPELAQAAATAVGYPQNVVAFDFSKGFNQQLLNGESDPKSASYLAQTDGSDDYFSLSVKSGDPFTIVQHPRLGLMNVTMTKPAIYNGVQLFLYLSKDPLVDGSGYLAINGEFDGVLKFPDFAQDEKEFLLTYVHPGDYYVTAVVDVNGDGAITAGDYGHASFQVTVPVEDNVNVTVDNFSLELK